MDSGAGYLPTAPQGKRRKYSICLWPQGHLERSPICHFYTSNLQRIDYYLFSYHKKLGRPEKPKEDLNIKHLPKLTESRAELFDLGFCSKDTYLKLNMESSPCLSLLLSFDIKRALVGHIMVVSVGRRGHLS